MCDLTRAAVSQQTAWTRARRFEREIHVSWVGTPTVVVTEDDEPPPVIDDDVLLRVLSPACALQRTCRRLIRASGCASSSWMAACRSGSVVVERASTTSSRRKSCATSSRQSDASESIAADVLSGRLRRSRSLDVTLVSDVDVVVTSHSDVIQWTDVEGDEAGEWIVSACDRWVPWAHVTHTHTHTWKQR